jgi:translation initiation factor 3 subunit B
MGTLLATLHRQGIRLWGGTSWSPVQKFAHPLVQLIDFSPNERYLVTWSNEPIIIPEGAPQGPQYLSREDEGNSIAVWDIKTGNLLRTFPSINAPAAPSAGEGLGGRKQQMHWPALKWSPDDRYVARVTPGQQISVYELPDMHLLDKKSIKIEGVVDFEWSPMADRDREDASTEVKGDGGPAKGRKAKENILGYWSPEMGNQPVRVSLMSIPSRTMLRSKNLFNVTEVCSIFPHLLRPRLPGP